MRILILSQTFPLTSNDSTAHFMYDFALGFKSIKQQVFILLPYHPKLKISQFKGLKITSFRYIWPDSLHLLGYGRSLINDQKLPIYAYLMIPFYLFFGFIASLNLVKKERIEVMNAHWLIPNGILAALVSKVTGIPLVITMPGSDVYLAQKNFLFKALAQFALKQAKEVVSNSPQLLTDLKVNGKVISYGVPLNQTGPAAKVSRLSLQNRSTSWGSRPVKLQSGSLFRVTRYDENVKIATAGRMVEKKGFDFLQSICPDIKIISGLPIFDFRRKLRSVDIFIAPSIRDSMGNLDDASLVVLEAMAAGCAVVVSNLPGYRKIIKHGQDGLLIKPNDKIAWQKAIAILKRSNKQRLRLGRTAQERITSEFTPVKIAKKYLKLFKA